METIKEILEEEKAITRIGITRGDKSETKKHRKMAKLSRKINRQRANKKSRKTGSNKRK